MPMLVLRHAEAGPVVKIAEDDDLRAEFWRREGRREKDGQKSHSKLIKPEESPVPIFNITALLAAAAVGLAC